MKFANWLQAQVDRDDPVGDLAGDVFRCPPSAPDWGVDELRAHMRSRGACRESMRALNDAASEFRSGVVICSSLI